MTKIRSRAGLEALIPEKSNLTVSAKPVSLRLMIRTRTRTLDDTLDRLIILSDIHAHLPPLKAFDQARLRLKGRNQVLFNGDLCFGGPRPAEAAVWLQDTVGELATLGNHDEGMLRGAQGEHPPYTERGAYLRLNEKQRDYFRQLPHRWIFSWRGKKIVLMHGHLTRDEKAGSWQAVPEEQIANFLDPTADLCVTGHTHYAFIRRVARTLFANCGSISAPILAVLNESGLHPQSGGKELTADDDPRSCFLSVTESGGSLDVEIIRFQDDREATLREMREAGHPRLELYTRWLTDGIYVER